MKQVKGATYLCSAVVEKDWLQKYYLDGSRRSIRLTNTATEAAKQHALHQMLYSTEKEAQRLAQNGLYRCQKAQR